MMRLIPSRAAIIGALAAVFAALLAWARRDARQDLKRKIERKDIQNAKDISDRVSSGRADPQRVRPYDNAGYRD